ncbi:MAG TPA: methionine--tRNA ligase [Candidatus Binataceae bacterium]|nr:methionine--tRNA ligase [Candidatus Binataceae bacterium]
MPDRIHLTTAIFYSNGTPHVGHASEAFAVDVFARYYRRKLGRHHVTFVTGTDEHGDKNYRAAAKAGLKPKEFVDRIAAVFKQGFDLLNISYDHFVRTTDEQHQKFVQSMLQRAYDKGEIYYKDYQGLYCIGCERFYTEKELLPGNICPAHNTPVELISEGNYFLRIEKYRERVLDHVRNNPDFIRPDRYRNEAINMLSEPIEDLCISRPKARLDWGIEMPFDTKYVTYVWFDAFWAYVSELPDTSDAALKEIMPVTEHFIGKDILKTHIVYWPAMLLIAGLPLYRSLNVHGWINFGGSRMSKSSGNVPDPMEYEHKYGADVLRYFEMRDIVYGLDADFSDERLIERYNSDLANNLGNLASRVLRMTQSYCAGEMKAAAGPRESGDAEIVDAFIELPSEVGKYIEALQFNRALDAIQVALDVANKYIVVTEPFKMAKDPAQLPRVEQILANLLEALRVAADLLEPFLPTMSAKLIDLLSVDENTLRTPYGKGLKPGHQVKPPIPLFPRIDKAKV